MNILERHGIIFDAEAHRYERFGTRVLSVSSVLPYLAGNAYLDANPQVMEKAGGRGNRVAKFIEAVEIWRGSDGVSAINEQALREWPQGEDAWARAYARFQNETRFRALVSPTGELGCELFVYHPLLDYCGRLDLVGKIGKDVILIDVKATAIIPKTVGWQTAGYLEAYNQNAKEYGLPKATKRACLHLNPKLYKSGYRLEPLTNPHDFANFLSLLNTNRLAAELGMRLNWELIVASRALPEISEKLNEPISPSEAFA